MGGRAASILDAERAREAKQRDWELLIEKARGRQEEIFGPARAIQALRFDRSQDFWEAVIDPILTMGDVLRGLDGKRHIEAIAKVDAHLTYAKEIMRRAIEGDRQGVRKAIEALTGSDIGDDFREIVARCLCEDLPEYLARADWLMCFPESRSEARIDRYIIRETVPAAEPERKRSVAELAAAINERFAADDGGELAVDGAKADADAGETASVPGNGQSASKTGKSRFTRKQADDRAREIARDDRRFRENPNVRKWAKRIGCSTGLITQLPYYAQCAHKAGTLRRGSKPRKMSFTNRMEATTAGGSEAITKELSMEARDRELAKLAREQAIDDRTDKVRG